MGESRKIVGFKKFSDIKESKSKIEEIDPSSNVMPESTSDLPMNPNLPPDSDKIEKPASRKGIVPVDQDINLSDEDDDNEFSEEDDEYPEDLEKNENVSTIGRVAKFPKGVKASKAFNFLEAVKISKKSIWYIMVEKMTTDGEILQLVKYNVKEGVDLNKFVNDLKSYYMDKYKGNKSLCESISKIAADGNDKFSSVTNIPLVTVDGRKLISVITEDLIKLLSK